jgi:hypothetical protein
MKYKIAFGFILAACVAISSHVLAQTDDTINQFLTSCTASNDCPDQVADNFAWALLIVPSGQHLCNGTAYLDKFVELPKAEQLRIVASVVPWLKAHPETLKMSVGDGLSKAFDTLYACPKPQP